MNDVVPFRIPKPSIEAALTQYKALLFKAGGVVDAEKWGSFVDFVWDSYSDETIMEGFTDPMTFVSVCVQVWFDNFEEENS